MSDSMLDRSRVNEGALAQLAAGLAHELRNPLNSAKLQLASVTRHPSVELHPAVDLAIRAALLELERTADLVDDYLSLVEPRRIQPREATLAEVASEAVQQILLRGCSRRVTIDNLISGDLPTVWVDPPRIAQVFMHLVRNSLESIENHPKALIRLEAEAAASMVVVRVWDNGPGLAEDLRAVAFRPFVTTKAAGTGLGLTIVRQLVAAHGGEVSLVSEGGETWVRFTLPQA